ncbi:MAG: hypothetical protein AAF702_15950 [Chloroflexota bacterium]
MPNRMVKLNQLLFCTGVVFLYLTLFYIWSTGHLETQFAFAAQEQAKEAQNIASAPVVGRVQRIYDASLGTKPDEQGMLYAALPGVAVAHSFMNGATILDTSLLATEYAGYSPSNTIVISRTQGFAVRTAVQVQAETHLNNNRAGFSIIALSGDNQGIEIGFWPDSIWAQEGGTALELFTRAEVGSFDTTAAVTDYDLVVLDSGYAVQTAGTNVVSGQLRDYTAATGSINPYAIPNFLFWGDDTTSASARIALESIALILNQSPANRSVDSGVDLIIDDIGVIDIDGSDSITLTLSVLNGTLTVPTDGTGGLTADDITNNGTDQITLVGSPVAINNTLAPRAGGSAGVTYRSDDAFSGEEILTIVASDLTTDVTTASDQKTLTITVNGIVDTATSTPTNTETSTATATPTGTLTQMPPATPSATAMPIDTFTATPGITPTGSTTPEMMTPTAMPSFTPTQTPTSTSAATPTTTPLPAGDVTATPTATSQSMNSDSVYLPLMTR